jgi:hypothetical protein
MTEGKKKEFPKRIEIFYDDPEFDENLKQDEIIVNSEEEEEQVYRLEKATYTGEVYFRISEAEK